MINARSYRRRCRECWHSDEFPLPEVRKKVIYLDQMAISNMAKVLLGRPMDAFWREMLERIDVLSKMQLVICPDSQAHREESAVVPYADALRDLYEMFSHGASFDFPHEVAERQLLDHLNHWLAGRPAQSLDLNVEDVTNGQIHGWQERFYIRVGNVGDGDWVDELRRSRSRGHAGMTQVFQSWRQEAHFDFEAMYHRELRSFGEVTMAQHVRSVERQARILAVGEPMDFEALLPSNATTLLLNVRQALRVHGVSDEEAWAKVGEFLTSPSLDAVPYLRISCLLFTALARKAAIGGQRTPPNRGTLADITTVATVLPYCDAVFTDNEIAGLLSEEPLRTRIEYGTLVFSQNRRQAFLDYLAGLRDAVTEDHAELVREVYGESYLLPMAIPQ